MACESSAIGLAGYLGEGSVLIPEPIKKGTAAIETEATARRNRREEPSVFTLRSSVLVMQRAHCRRR